MNASGASRPANWPSAPARSGAAPVVTRPQAQPSTSAAPAHAGAGRVAAAAQAIASDAADSPWTTPFLFVLGYLFIDFARPQDWLSPLQALRPGMLVQSAGCIALFKYKHDELPRIGKYIVAFLCVMAIGIPFATNNFFAFRFTKDFAIFLVGGVLPLMAFVVTPQQTTILFRFWIFINALLAFYGITHGGRGVGSFLGDENDFCLAVNVALPYSLFMLSAARSWRERVFLLVCVGLALASVVISMSRGGFIGLVAVGVAFWARSPHKFRTILLVLVAVAALSLSVSDSYWKEMQTIQTADQEGDTGATRLYFWGIGWKMFLDNPILGVGPSNFSYNSFNYEDPEKAARGFHIWGKAAHSVYFTLLPEEGIAGVIVFLLIIGSGWRLRRGVGIGYRNLMKTNPEAVTQELKELLLISRAIDVSLLAYLVTGAFISVLYHPHFWLIAGFSVVVRRAFDMQMQQLASAPAAAASPSGPGWRVTRA